VLVVAIVLPGCRTSGQIIVNTPDATYSIQQSAASVTTLALKALSKDDASFQSVKVKSQIAQQAIETVVLPLFKGQDLNSITAATAAQALSLLDGKIDPTLKGVIQLAVNAALVFLKLPDNPTTKLTDEQRAMIVALFQGIDQGITSFLLWTGPGSRDISMTVPLVRSLAWKQGGGD
jgi:hypothetical protein